MQNSQSEKMIKDGVYKNGQKIHELIGNKLTYFYKNGKVKAAGIFENEQFFGEWIFYRETGQLWQVENFKNGKKEVYGKINRVNCTQSHGVCSGVHELE